jgi:hypothetical protein
VVFDAQKSAAQFRVYSPIKDSGHINYIVSGVDADVSFKETRDLTLRKALAQRWPGLHIPAIPDKKMIGNKYDKSF